MTRRVQVGVAVRHDDVGLGALHHRDGPEAGRRLPRRRQRIGLDRAPLDTEQPRHLARVRRDHRGPLQPVRPRRIPGERRHRARIQHEGPCGRIGEQRAHETGGLAIVHHAGSDQRRVAGPRLFDHHAGGLRRDASIRRLGQGEHARLRHGEPHRHREVPAGRDPDLAGARPQGRLRAEQDRARNLEASGHHEDAPARILAVGLRRRQAAFAQQVRGDRNARIHARDPPRAGRSLPPARLTRTRPGGIVPWIRPLESPRGARPAMEAAETQG